jgi:hypothetical protein
VDHEGDDRAPMRSHAGAAFMGKELGISNFSFLFLGILRDEQFIFVKSSIFQTRDRQQPKT